jgi:regulation of enolase protein 1 (concanavalin A-like superfamily)
MIGDPWLDESFVAAALDARLVWHAPPPRWETGPHGLLVAPATGTDFWQGTHYGFRVDNGHALLAEMPGDGVLETRVRTRPVHQYDQAGLMVRLSPASWLKCSVEFEPGEPSRLGAVVTNAGWSDWSTQDIDPVRGQDVAFRVTRKGANYLVEAAPAGERWSQIRLGRLHDDQGGPVRAGLYACSPKGAGFEARFERLVVTLAPP